LVLAYLFFWATLYVSYDLHSDVVATSQMVQIPGIFLAPKGMKRTKFCLPTNDAHKLYPPPRRQNNRVNNR